MNLGLSNDMIPKLIPQYIPDIFSKLVANVGAELDTQVIFDFGHMAEIVKNIAIKDGANSELIYPLVWLVMSFDESMGGSTDLYTKLEGIRIIIATRTEANYTMQERRDKSFLPVLYPIYASLFNQMSLMSEFRMPSPLKILHKKTDWPYWGKVDQDGNGEANFLNDYVDVVEIKNLKLDISRLVC